MLFIKSIFLILEENMYILKNTNLKFLLSTLKSELSTKYWNYIY